MDVSWKFLWPFKEATRECAVLSVIVLTGPHLFHVQFSRKTWNTVDRIQLDPLCVPFGSLIVSTLLFPGRYRTMNIVG